MLLCMYVWGANEGLHVMVTDGMLRLRDYYMRGREERALNESQRGMMMMMKI